MDIRKKKLYEVFIDSLEKSKTKEGGLLPNKLFEDIWEYVEPNLGQLLPKHLVSHCDTVIKEVDKMTQRNQVQYDTQRQLRELYFAANKLGLYDAADFVKKSCG